MDPIADKLLIVAALVALVSLGRLEAWVAMVVISREFAVTALRLAAGAQQGVVISASSFGKLKTAFQVAMVMSLIAVGKHPVWVTVLVYVTVVGDGPVGSRLLLRAAAAAQRDHAHERRRPPRDMSDPTFARIDRLIGVGLRLAGSATSGRVLLAQDRGGRRSGADPAAVGRHDRDRARGGARRRLRAGRHAPSRARAARRLGIEAHRRARRARARAGRDHADVAGAPRGARRRAGGGQGPAPGLAELGAPGSRPARRSDAPAGGGVSRRSTRGRCSGSSASARSRSSTSSTRPGSSAAFTARCATTRT